MNNNKNLSRKERELLAEERKKRNAEYDRRFRAEMAEAEEREAKFKRMIKESNAEFNHLYNDNSSSSFPVHLMMCPFM
jgi:hypothetical protein